MNQFIKNLIPLLFLIVVYIILFLDQDNNPYNKILKLDLKKSKNTFKANDLESNETENETTGESNSIEDIEINPNWIRFFEIK